KPDAGASAAGSGSVTSWAAVLAWPVSPGFQRSFRGGSACEARRASRGGITRTFLQAGQRTFLLAYLSGSLSSLPHLQLTRNMGRTPEAGAGRLRLGTPHGMIISAPPRRQREMPYRRENRRPFPFCPLQPGPPVVYDGA